MSDTSPLPETAARRRPTSTHRRSIATALHWAIYRDDADMVDDLIRAGANVKAANRDGVTPLAMAALYDKPATMLKLLKAGADAKEVGANGQTVLISRPVTGIPTRSKC